MSHIGRDLNLCPECATYDGWQNAHGMRYAAQIIRHEATTEDERDLADLCEWVATHHHDNGSGKCAECGDDWGGHEADLGYPMPCLIFSQTKFEKDAWIGRQVQAMAARYANVRVIA